MKVLHFSYSGEGGAGRAAQRLVDASRSVGIDARLMVGEGQSSRSDQEILSPILSADDAEKSNANVEQFLRWDYCAQRRASEKGSIFTLPATTLDFSRFPPLDWADIIHLHWITWLWSPLQVKKALDAGKKIVWTFHDCWPLTGGCHYTAGCDQYLTHCWTCPQLKDDGLAVPQFFAQRLRAFDHPSLKVIAPSRWLGMMAQSGAVFRRADVHVIPNTLDNGVFRFDADLRRTQRAMLGVSESDIVLAYGGLELNDWRKGGDLLRDALFLVANRDDCAAALDRLCIVSFGAGRLASLPPRFRHVHTGLLRSEREVADLLGAADFYVHPAREDNYPNSVLESLCVGTPVIGFNVGGMADLIDDSEAGIAREPPSAAALADAICEHIRDIRDDGRREKLSKRVGHKHSFSVIGLAHRSVYEKLASSVPASLRLAESSVRQYGLRKGLSAELAALKFPFSKFLQSNLEDVPEGLGALGPRRAFPSSDGRIRVTVVRTWHRHHSSVSGPHQYLKFLSANEFDLDEIIVPIGHELARDLPPPVVSAVRALGFPAMANQPNQIVAELELISQLESGPPQVIHFIDGDLGGWLASAMGSTLRARGHAVCATVHQPPRVLREFIDPAALARFDRVITLCGQQREFVEEFADACRTSLIPHGVDIDFFRPCEKPSERAVPSILMVGNWLRDYPFFVAVLEEVRRRGVAFEATAVTSTEFRSPPDLVKICRSVSDQELSTLYQHADLFLLPLIDATANNSLLEAMASGLPIVATDVGGVREATGDAAAVLTGPGDLDGMVEAVIALLRDSARRGTMGAAARSKAEKVRWAAIADRHAELYRELANGAVGREPPRVTSRSKVASGAKMG